MQDGWVWDLDEIFHGMIGQEWWPQAIWLFLLERKALASMFPPGDV
jgi:hypothetical protein